jgi:hypothetical protein
MKSWPCILTYANKRYGQSGNSLVPGLDTIPVKTVSTMVFVVYLLNDQTEKPTDSASSDAAN